MVYGEGIGWLRLGGEVDYSFLKVEGSWLRLGRYVSGGSGERRDWGIFKISLYVISRVMVKVCVVFLVIRTLGIRS